MSTVQLVNIVGNTVVVTQYHFVPIYFPIYIPFEVPTVPIVPAVPSFPIEVDQFQCTEESRIS